MERYNSYSVEQVNFLKENSFKMNREELTVAFNKHFETDKSLKAIDSWCRKHKFYSTNRYYSPEQKVFLEEYARLLSRKELTEAFNRKFGTHKTMQALKGWCNARGYNAASDGRFKEGDVTWQTGLSKEEFRSHYTEESFHQMLHPMREANIKYKIGDEITDHGTDDPYIVTSLDYSLDFHSRTTPKGRYIWEQAHGPVTEGYCVIYLDGNHKNCDLSNLACIPLKYRMIMAKNQWFTNSREHTLAAIKWCELFYAMRGQPKQSHKHEYEKEEEIHEEN